MSFILNKNILLLSIIILALFLRFNLLSQNPPSLTWDEAAWGYNAYSLGIDGRDEFGKFIPITYIESFGDFKPPLYAYLSIIPVKLFGLTEFSTRFVSAFLGVLTVLLTFFLTKEIFGKKDQVLPILSTFILAVSPWHILLSRAAFEANVATFFIVLGAWLFLVSLKRNKWFVLISFISFIFSMYTFNTARIVVPILVLVLLFAKRKYILSSLKKQFVASCIVSFVLFLPLLFFLQTPQAKLRFAEVNIFSDSSIVNTANQEIENDNNAAWSRLIHNRRFLYGLEYIKHYFDNLNPLFLFVKGDGNPKFSIQDVGQLYIWEIPFFVVGLLFLFKKREGDWWIVPAWALIGIIPAGTARETPHALRTEVVLPMFQIITAYGIYYFSQVFSKTNYKILRINISYLIFSALGLFVLLNFSYFYHNYFNHYPKEFSGEWQYSYKEAINYIDSVEDDYDKIIFTESLGRPYIYALFYKKYNPRDFQKEALIEREALGFVHVRQFDKFVFTENASKVSDKGRLLFVDIPENVPENAKILKIFRLLNGNPSLVAYVK